MVKIIKEDLFREAIFMKIGKLIIGDGSWKNLKKLITEGGLFGTRE